MDGLLQRLYLGVTCNLAGSLQDGIHFIHFSLYLLFLKYRVRVVFFLQPRFVNFILNILPEKIETLLSTGGMRTLIQLFKPLAQHLKCLNQREAR